MPHVVIEHSADLTNQILTTQAVDGIHAVVTASGLFDVEAVKTRRIAYDDYRIGPHGMAHSFVHVTIAIMDGRTEEQRRTLATQTAAWLDQHLHFTGQITVDIREMCRAVYTKVASS